MTSRKIALMFPGQGAQYAGMGRSMAEAFPSVAALFGEADEALGFPISKLCFEGPEEALKLTENTQPALLTTAVGAFRVLSERGVRPDFVAGHSLGEYSGLVAAGSIEFSSAVSLVRNRGRYMQEAVPVGEGAMAAILGLDSDVVRAVCERVQESEVVTPANFNSPAQVVIAGHRPAVERAIVEAKSAGARRALLLPVSAPFHCSLMLPAEKRLSDDLDAVDFRDLQFPIVTNVDAEEVRTGSEAREAVRRQTSRPVRWYETVRFLLDSGVDTFIEVGPGKVLTGLLRSIEKSVTMLNAEDEASLDQAMATLHTLQ
jgi:[acyl-carrier-protein] S-malonyltransferase